MRGWVEGVLYVFEEGLGGVVVAVEWGYCGE